jgi:hypothetical protein
MLLASLVLYLLGFGLLLMDARFREGYSIPLATVSMIFILLAMMLFIGGMLSKKRLSSDSHQSLP